MKAYPWRSVLMIGCLLFSGLAEGISILTLLPLMEIATSGGITGHSSIGLIVKNALDVLGLEPKLPVMLGLIVIGITVKSTFLFFAMKQAGYTVAYVTTDLRLMLIKVLLAARWNYFISQPAGYFTNAIGNEAMRASSAYYNSVLLIASVIQVLVYGIAAMMLSWKVTLFAAIFSILLLLPLNRFIKMSRSAGDRQTELMKSLIARLTDALQGIKPIKAMAREANLQPLLEAETHDLNTAQQQQVIAGQLRKAVQEPSIVVLVAIGIYVVLTFGNYQFSVILVMVLLFHRSIYRAYSVQAFYQAIATVESAFWSLRGTIEHAEAQRESTIEGCKLKSFKKVITLNSVKFSYGENTVLKNASMDIPAGQIVAIIGPSGAGKTTIADLVIGLFRPQSGTVCVDDVPLSELNLRAWRQMIGYVPQEMFLFHDTIYRNVSLGDNKITRTDAEEALRDAGAWDFVSSLASDMDSVIGERGAKLSGGQRQRISIARALVHKPNLLILDEVTTALDPKTEAAICETLRKLRGKVAILAISHQPAMMEIADKVYRLKDGLIEELNPLHPTESEMLTNQMDTWG